MDRNEWIARFRRQLHDLGLDCTPAYAAGYYDAAHAPEEVAYRYGNIVVPGVIREINDSRET